MIALGAVLARELNVDVQQRYLDSAKTSATLIAQVGVQPLLTPEELRTGFSPADIAQIDQRLQGATVNQDVRRLKIWNQSGTVVYSDNHGLIGRKFNIEDDLQEALEGHSSADISDGRAAENQGDDLQGPLVEVYVPLLFKGDATPSGAFELYLPYAPVQAAIDNELRNLYVILALGLTLFYASMFPVAVIADRWRRRLKQEAENTALANLAVLERLNKLKSEFLMRISHQFRTALVGIEGFSELIRDSEDLDLDKVRTFAGDIYNDAERLDQAFTDMLELDSMETGASVLKLSRVDVNEVISAVVDAIRKDSPRARLVFARDAQNATVTADKEKVAQVVRVMIGNAIKYSPPGSTVTIATRESRDELVVSVADHGPGMPADFDNGLFVGYTPHNGQGGNGAHPGTGLGLPIARQIVEMHGGRIWFDSATGEGTTFHFTLPLRVRPSREMHAVSRP